MVFRRRVEDALRTAPHQVTSQLGDVLDFRFPGVFGAFMEALKPVMDIWGLLFRALGPSECFGIQGFSAQFMLRVLG